MAWEGKVLSWIISDCIGGLISYRMNAGGVAVQLRTELFTEPL